jgi:hypothetical protein
LRKQYEPTSAASFLKTEKEFRLRMLKNEDPESWITYHEKSRMNLGEVAVDKPTMTVLYAERIIAIYYLF